MNFCFEILRVDLVISADDYNLPLQPLQQSSTEIVTALMVPCHLCATVLVQNKSTGPLKKVKDIYFLYTEQTPSCWPFMSKLCHYLHCKKYP